MSGVREHGRHVASINEVQRSPEKMMKRVTILRGLGLMFCAITSLALMAPAPSAASPTPSDTTRLKAAGIDVNQLKAGWAVVGDEIWWDGGNVKRSIVPTAFVCDSGYVCLYVDGDFLGNLLEIRSPINTYLYMPNYGFNDVMSSWINKRGLDARWYYHTSGTPNPNRCMASGTHDEHLPVADNDQMSTLYIYNSTTVC